MCDTTEAVMGARRFSGARFLLAWFGTLTCGCYYPRLDLVERSAASGGTTAKSMGSSKGGGSSIAAGGGTSSLTGTTGSAGQPNIGGTSSVTGGVSASDGSGGASNVAGAAGTTTTGGADPAAGAPATGGAGSSAGSTSTGGSAPSTLARFVSAGLQHTCAVQRSGQIQCWGDNSSKALGYETTSVCAKGGSSWDCSTTPNPVTSITSALLVASGSNHTCAIVGGAGDSRGVQCWGSNQYGQLGYGTATDTPLVSPVTVAGISTAYALSAGARQTCVVLSEGTIQCWGDNRYGQLGDGSAVAGSATPVTVTGIRDASGVACGAFHSCAVVNGTGLGQVMCWGRNDVGQLGINLNTAISASPVTVAGISNAVVVAAGTNHSCALLQDNTMKCWGANGAGQLGDGTWLDSYQPVTALTYPDFEFDGVVGIAAGLANSTCAAHATGPVQCWGTRITGNFNATWAMSTSSNPIPVDGVTDAVSVTCGAWHCCALLSSGRIQCWGDNSWGELGDGGTGVAKGTSFVLGF